MSKSIVLWGLFATALLTGLGALLGGPEIAAGAFTVCGTILVGHLGAEWSYRQSAEAEECRQKFIGKRPSPTIYYDDDGEPIPNYIKDPENN